MVRILTCCFALAFALILMRGDVFAQTVNLSNSSTSVSASGDSAVGAGISDTLSGFTQGSPELQEAQDLRDTSSRGTSVRGEAGDVPDFLGGQEQGSQARTAQEMGGMGRSRARGQQGASRPQFRTRLVIGFPYTPKVSPSIGRTTRVCLERIPDFGKTASIRARVEKNVVILEGTVASKHDKALALQMVALEPGVVKVDNRLKVVPCKK